MRRFTLLLLSTLLLSLQLLAQNRTITGKVTDDKNVGVPSASVTVKGTSVGTVTNADGNFTLSIAQNARTLVVSAVGLGTKEIDLTSASVYNVSLSSTATDMQEVVVVGYQQRRKRDEAGTISTIRAGEIENLPVASLDKAMQGKAAGVVVQSNNGIPGGAITVRIRGYGSINAGNQPLYIVDGVQLNTTNTTTFTQSNPLAFLNPNDIESIDILKDAATAAIYGASASNGVVIITTKRGRAGKTKFQFNTYFGQAERLSKLNVLNSQDYFQARTEARMNGDLQSSLAAKRTTLVTDYRFPNALVSSLSEKSLDSLAATVPTYDWQDAAFRQGNIQNYELSVSGGNDRTTFRLSANHNRQQAIITAADFVRSGVNINLTNRATDKLTLTTNVNLSTFNQKAPFGGAGGSSLGNLSFAASGILPFNPFYNADGSFYGLPGQNPASLSGVLNQNALAVNEYNTANQRTNQAIGNIQGEYKLTNWLSFRTFYALDYRTVETNSFWDPRTNDGAPRGGLGQAGNNWNTNFLTNQVLSARHTIGDKHNIDGLLGYEYRKEDARSIFVSAQGFPTPQFRTLASAATASTYNETGTGFRRQGVFANFNYNYDSRYVVGLVGRYDGSSRFGANTRYGFFPGLKLAWNIDRESFMEGANAVSSLRLRFGIGKTGNDQIGNFDARGLYGGGPTYSGLAGITYTQLANPELTWEGNTTKNLGIDFGFFRDRISGSVEVYDRITNDLLLSQTVAWTSGFDGISSNVGKVQNRGVELTLNGSILKSRDAGGFNWNTTFVFAYNKSKLLELFGNTQNIGTSYVVGKPLFLVQAAPYAGVNPATGRAMWYDSTGNLTYQIVTPKDNKVLGDELPEFTGGLTNTFTYKGFSLDVFFQYEYGRLVNDGQVSFLSEASGRINWLQEVYDKRWTTPGQVTSVPRMNLYAEQKNSGAQAGSRMWYKGDYVRLKYVTLSYDLPTSIASRLRLSGLKVYVQGTNLYTYADSPSYDPEFLGAGTGQIPQSRNYTVGLQIGF
ncbi:MAG TPA: TonB-dependent receptor [Flavisolibacter sp.]|nr:TonB-dependent receptor [Flavisolibacter sp.]